MRERGKPRHLLTASDVQKSDYLMLCAKKVGVERFLRRCKIYHVMYGGAKSERTRCWSMISLRVRQFERVTS